MKENDYPFSKLSPYIVQQQQLSTFTDYEVKTIPARELLLPQRIDLVAKLIYIDAKVKNCGLATARKIYEEHIRAFSSGTFIEPGSKTKTSIAEYFRIFDELIESIRQNGLQPEISLLPVGENGILLDGSHRASIAIYLNLEVPILSLPTAKAYTYDYDFFLRQKMDSDYLDFLAFCYCRQAQNVYAAFLWPAAENDTHRLTAQTVLGTIGQVIACKDLYLSRWGMRNLMIQLYGHQDWIGDVRNQYAGIDDKVDLCYVEGKPTTVILFSCSSLSKVTVTKKEIRNLFALENHAIHISDTHKEAVQSASLAFNNRSIHHLCFGFPYKYTETLTLLEKYLSSLLSHQPTLDDYVIDASFVLAVYGIRPAKDLDYLTLVESGFPPTFSDNRIQNHKEELKYYTHSLDTLVLDPKNHFWYRGLKILTPAIVAEMKKKRGEKKDIADVKSIRRLMKISLSEHRKFDPVAPKPLIPRYYGYIVTSLKSGGLPTLLKNTINYFAAKFRPH